MFSFPEHAWNDVMRGDVRMAYVCANCGRQIPTLIVIGQPAVLSQLRAAGRIEPGADVVESPYVPDGQAYAMDARAGEFMCTGAP